jgi:hypothetical protein
MNQSPDPAQVRRVTLDRKGSELALSGAWGPLTLNAYLYAFDVILNPPTTFPASLAFAVFPGPGVDLAPVLTVTAAATEIQFPNYPIQTAGRFLTPYVRYEQPRQAGENPPGQAIELVCTVEGTPHSPLRVGFMVTLGKLAGADAPAESVPPSGPPTLRAAYSVAERQPPMVDVYSNLTSRTPDPRTERPLHAITAQGGEPIGGIIVGPLRVTNVLFCSVNRNQWARPGFNTFMIDLRELSMGTVWTVNADVSELKPPASPWTGSASFWTLGAQLDFRSQRAYVYCSLGDSEVALPVAVMLTIGYA